MTRRVLFGAVLAVGLGSSPASAAPPADPRTPEVILFGIWPNQLRLLDESTDEIVGDIQLKYGAATNSTHTLDFKKFYFVTDRMEAVEIVDMEKRAVVDTVRLSDQGRQVRIAGVAVNPIGTHLYLSSTPVTLEIDRFVPGESEIFVYNLETKRLESSFELPKDVRSGFRPNIHFSPDGSSIFLFGRDIYEVRASDHETIDTITLSKPLLAGYGPYRGPRLTEEEPGVYYGLYRTKDPVMGKTMMGVMRIDLLKKSVESFELGPNVNVGLFALSSDKKRAYAGLTDMITIDMESRTIVKRAEGVEQGRTNTALVVSTDGKKLYVGGVGDTIQVYDTETLTHQKGIFAGGDFMVAPIAVPRSAVMAGPGN